MNVHTYPNFGIDVWNNPGQAGNLLPSEAADLAQAATYSGMITKVQWLYRLMSQFGISKPVIVTEWGISADGNVDGAQAQLNVENQMQMAVQGAIEFVAANHDPALLPGGVPAATLFTLSDNDIPNWGITDHSYTPRNAFLALRYLQSRLAGANYLGRIPQGWWDPAGNKVDGFRFEQNGKEFLVIWSRFNQVVATSTGFNVTAPSVDVSLTGYSSLVVRDPFGSPLGTLSTSSSGVISLSVGATPLLLEPPATSGPFNLFLPLVLRSLQGGW
jgi:hypothetical protein